MIVALVSFTIVIGGLILATDDGAQINAKLDALDAKLGAQIDALDAKVDDNRVY